MLEIIIRNNMGVVKDLSGQTFNGITAVRITGINKHNNRIWEFICHCGKRFKTVGSQVSTGHTKSCGCSTRSHGDHGTLFYKRWVGMRNRCLNVNDKQYKHWGGRGIKICKRWEEYLNFKEDMFESFKPELSLDRINVNGDYSPENCRWATIIEQNRNKRNNTLIDTPKGKMSVIEAAEAFGIKETALHYRIKNQPYELWFVKKYQSWKSKRSL